MKVLFLISHPAHFHMFKHTIDNLKHDGHSVCVVIRPKDVLEQLCINSAIPFYKVKSRPNKHGMFGLAFALVRKTIDVLKIAKKEKPDLLVGSDGVLAVVGKLIHRPSFECCEDDAEAISLYARMFFPIYTNLVTPDCCSVWKWKSKKIGYPSYHELGYLHPNQFIPCRKVVEQYGIDASKPYIVIRFAQLVAYHDVGIHGITTEIAGRIIEMLSSIGRIYITSERPLEEQFEKYRIRINPLDIHHILSFATLYIGDSQTMAAEAGVLGTPFVRFNDFVGRLSYLNEIENVYHLGYGHKTSDVNGLYSSIQKWIDTPNRKDVCSERRNKMLDDKIDYSKFLTWFIENYPKSKEIITDTPEWWRQFK